MLSRSRWLALFGLCVALTGCGTTFYPVSGVVTLDGKEVEGATVSFTSNDGQTGSGFTDASGKFIIMGPGGKNGLPAGEYKVTIVKTAKFEGDTKGGEGQVMGGDYQKYIDKTMKEAKTKKASSGPPGMGPGMGPSMQGKTMSAGVKTELPEKYAYPDRSGFSVKVPVDGGQPVKFEMKGK